MIAIDCRVVGAGTGVDFYTRDLVQALVEADKAAELLLLVSSQAQRELLPSAVAVKLLPPKKVLFDHFRFRNYVSSPDIKAVVHPDNTALLFDHPNTIVVLHDVLPWQHAEAILSNYPLMRARQQIYLALQEQAFKQVKKIVTVSAASKREILNVLGSSMADRVVVIPESVDKVFTQHPQLSRSALLTQLGVSKYAFYIGGFERNKNVAALLRAFDQSAYPGDLVLAGRLDSYAEAPEIRRLVASLARQPSIHFVGPVDQDRLIALYHYADFFVYPPVSGGFGRPILEAMKAGCPVLCSPAPSFKEVGGEAAWYVDSANTAIFALHMQELDSLKPAARQQLSAKIAKQAAKFNWAEAAQQFWAELMHVTHNES